MEWSIRFHPQVNLVSSSIEPRTQVADPVPSSISPALHQESDTKAVDPFPPVDPILPLENETKVVSLVTLSVNPTLSLKSYKVTDPVPFVVSPTLPPKSAKVADPVLSSVSPTLPLKSAKVVAPVTSSVNPTLPLKSAKAVIQVHH
jgi:hypothetical protein